ncbi:MAG TPA: toast rack family protein [Bryobacteraceae bacterium]|jgi:hypothetical protein
MRVLAASTAITGGLILCSCAGVNVNVDNGPVKTDHVAIDLDKAEIVNTKLHMGVGEMTVKGGATKLMEGDFSYSIPSWKPEIKYSSTGFRGTLTIDQPSKAKGLSSNAGDYKWDIKLSDKVAQDFEFVSGVGVTHADLSTMNIRSIDVKMGVGELELNLRGKPEKDYSVTIKGGVGEARILLPKDIGVIANASGGLGGVDTTGMSQNGNQYVNDAYQKSPVTIRLTISGGVGGIKLLCE